MARDSESVEQILGDIQGLVRLIHGGGYNNYPKALECLQMGLKGRGITTTEDLERFSRGFEKAANFKTEDEDDG